MTSDSAVADFAPEPSTDVLVDAVDIATPVPDSGDDDTEPAADDAGAGIIGSGHATA